MFSQSLDTSHVEYPTEKYENLDRILAKARGTISRCHNIHNGSMDETGVGGGGHTTANPTDSRYSNRIKARSTRALAATYIKNRITTFRSAIVTYQDDVTGEETLEFQCPPFLSNNFSPESMKKHSPSNRDFLKENVASAKVATSPKYRHSQLRKHTIIPMKTVRSNQWCSNMIAVVMFLKLTQRLADVKAQYQLGRRPSQRFSLCLGRVLLFRYIEKGLLRWAERAKLRVKDRCCDILKRFLKAQLVLRSRCLSVQVFSDRIRRVQRQVRVYIEMKKSRLTLLTLQWLREECKQLKCTNAVLNGFHRLTSTAGMLTTSANSLGSTIENNFHCDRLTWYPQNGTPLTERENILKPIVSALLKSFHRALIRYDLIRHQLKHAVDNTSLSVHVINKMLQRPRFYLFLPHEEVHRMVTLSVERQRQKNKSQPSATMQVPKSFRSTHSARSTRRMTNATSTNYTEITDGTTTLMGLAHDISATLTKSVVVTVPALTISPPLSHIEKTLRKLDELNEKSKAFEVEYAAAMAARQRCQHEEKYLTQVGHPPWRKPKPPDSSSIPPTYKTSQRKKVVHPMVPLTSAEDVHNIYQNWKALQDRKFSTLEGGDVMDEGKRLQKLREPPQQQQQRVPQTARPSSAAVNLTISRPVRHGSARRRYIYS
eukprot:PhF_6_TR31495/c0_g1_i1/m.46345